MRVVFDGLAGEIEESLKLAQEELRYYWAATLARRTALRDERESIWLHGSTGADAVCEEILKRRLDGVVAGASIISEEDAPEAINPVPPAKTAFLLDPLDGTHNAMAGYPMFTSSVALYHEGHWAFGWVYDISRDIAYVARQGHGSYIKTPLVTARLATRQEGSLHDMAVSFLRSKDLDARAALSSMLWEAKKVRLSSCSSIDLCLIAGGTLDAFVDLDSDGHERSCDIAAAALVLQEAGGVLMSRSGYPRAIPPPTATSIHDYGSLVAAGCAAGGAEILRTLREAMANSHQ